MFPLAYIFEYLLNQARNINLQISRAENSSISLNQPHFKKSILKELPLNIRYMYYIGTNIFDSFIVWSFTLMLIIFNNCIFMLEKSLHKNLKERF